VGLAPTGKRRFFTAHAESGRSRHRDRTGKVDPKPPFAAREISAARDPQRTLEYGFSEPLVGYTCDRRVLRTQRAEGGIEEPDEGAKRRLGLVVITKDNPPVVLL
jgi:hypothetical protein